MGGCCAHITPRTLDCNTHTHMQHVERPIRYYI